MLIQNGLGVEEPYHLAFPGVTIISGVAYLPTTQVSPGLYSHSEMELLYLGLYATDRFPQAVGQLDTFASLIGHGGATAVIAEDVQAQRWRKVVANGAFNPICALSRCRDRYLMEIAPLGSHLLKSVMLEVMAVAEAAGYGEFVVADTVEKQLARSLSRPYPGVQPSMMADVLEGKSREVGAIIGEIVRIGRENQVQIPRLETLFVLLQELEAALHKATSQQTSPSTKNDA